ncbi:MAG: P-II family nitrogen regulator [Clostridia bacterium]|nr:P-II family nitrogen regulator [Clostridia bacterium]
MNNDLIITIVNRGHADKVMEAARAKGATGGTVLNGRGTAGEVENFFGISIQSEKEIVMIVVDHDARRGIMEEISEKAGIKTVAQGVMFSLPVEESIGLSQ